jgi:hypothetical protein
MPISDFHHIPTVLHYALALRPRSVLDVGVGTGTYGFLLRELLDLDGACVNWADRRVRIEGVEIFEPYRNSVWDLAYDRVHLGDARALLPTLGSYDLILMNDVLEHLVRSEARALVRQALGHAKAIIATTPNRWWPQGALGGNDAETHRALLDASDFPNLVAEVRVGVTTCFVCSTDDDTAARLSAATAYCPVARVPLVRRLKRRAAQALPEAKRRVLQEWRRLMGSFRDGSG